MKFFKNKKGFTLVELVVVIAILGILAGIAVPRFMDATATARGAKIIADLRTLDSAATMFYAKNGAYPAADTDLKPGYVADIPTPPSGSAIFSGAPSATIDKNKIAAKYTYTVDTGRFSIGNVKNTAEQLSTGAFTE